MQFITYHLLVYSYYTKDLACVKKKNPVWESLKPDTGKGLYVIDVYVDMY